MIISISAASTSRSKARKAWRVYLSDRRYGVGGDGIVLIEPSAVADARMRIFNLDGSEGKMCGNGIRCVGKFLYDKGIVPKQDMTVETLSGIRRRSICMCSTARSPR